MLKNCFLWQWPMWNAMDWQGCVYGTSILVDYLMANLSIYLSIPTPPLGQDMTQGQFLSGV